MQDTVSAQILKTFIDRYGDMELQSTAATIVSYSGKLYNVEGSTDDPKIEGQNWKQLLIDNGISGNCYVTAPLPDVKSSHPGFNVGGHMTPNSSGEVDTGGTCYLMPICSWHNSKARDGIAFSHTETQMLKLTGYMQAEPAATFLARMPSEEPYAVVSADGLRLTGKPLAEAQIARVKAGAPVDEAAGAAPRFFILLRQIRKDGEIRFVVEDTRLS